MPLIILLSLVTLSSTSFVLFFLGRAPEGFEDSLGFHLAQVKVRSADLERADVLGR